MKAKTPYETMRELSILIGEINHAWEAALRHRGEKPEDLPPECYCDFAAARLVDAGYRKEEKRFRATDSSGSVGTVGTPINMEGER